MEGIAEQGGVVDRPGAEGGVIGADERGGACLGVEEDGPQGVDASRLRRLGHARHGEGIHGGTTGCCRRDGQEDPEGLSAAADLQGDAALGIGCDGHEKYPGALDGSVVHGEHEIAHQDSGAFRYRAWLDLDDLDAVGNSSFGLVRLEAEAEGRPIRLRQGLQECGPPVQPGGEGARLLGPEQRAGCKPRGQ